MRSSPYTGSNVVSFGGVYAIVNERRDVPRPEPTLVIVDAASGAVAAAVALPPGATGCGQLVSASWSVAPRGRQDGCRGDDPGTLVVACTGNASAVVLYYPDVCTPPTPSASFAVAPLAPGSLAAWGGPGGAVRNVLAVDSGGAVLDFEPVGALRLLPGPCALATTTPLGDVVVCACAPAGRDASDATALCGYVGRTLAYNVTVGGTAGGGADAWFVSALAASAAGGAVVVVAGTSTFSGAAAIGGFASSSGARLWDATFPRATVGAVVAVLAPPAAAVLWTVTEAWYPGAGIAGVAVDVWDAATGVRRAGVDSPAYVPVRGGAPAVAAPDGGAAYVTVIDALAGPLVAVLAFDGGAGVTLRGTLVSPALGAGDGGCFLSLGPAAGTLIAASAGGVATWSDQGGLDG